MNWGSWQNFWAMGGYASFVWGSFGVTLAAVAVETWLVKERQRRALHEARRTRRRGKQNGDETEA